MQHRVAHATHEVFNQAGTLEGYNAYRDDEALVDLPLIRGIVPNLAIESEAFVWLSMRRARALDFADTDRFERLLSRVGTPIAKYEACKRAPTFVAEALEYHGGNGFIAEHPMA